MRFAKGLLILLLALLVCSSFAVAEDSFEPLVLPPLESANATEDNASSFDMNGTDFNATIRKAQESNSTSVDNATEASKKGIPIQPIGSFEVQAHLQTQLEILKLQVQVAEQQKKLSELKLPMIPVSHAKQSMPLAQEKKNPTPIKKMRKKSWPLPALSSIHGVEGHLVATFSVSLKDGGKTCLTLRIGQNVSGWKIQKITTQQVVLERDGKTATLGIKE